MASNGYANDHSSRSHSLFSIYVNQKSGLTSTLNLALNLANLAGSESAKDTGTTGDARIVSANMNISLSMLGIVYVKAF